MFFSVKPYWYFLFSLTLTLALAGLISLQDNVWWIACSVLILLAGLPHGAYDLVIMRARHRGTELAMMVLGYIALVLAALVLWAFQPFVLLASFIVYSAFHFGDSDFAHAPWLHKFSWGAAILGIPALFSAPTVTALFATITGTSDVAVLVYGLAATGLIAALTHVLLAKQSGDAAAVLLIYALVCWVAGALVAFTCYFVFYHSPLHLRHWREQLGVEGAGIVYGLSVVVIGIIAGALWVSTSGRPIAFDAVNQTALRYTFITIAALTIPHMVLLMLVSRQNKAMVGPAS